MIENLSYVQISLLDIFTRTALQNYYINIIVLKQLFAFFLFKVRQIETRKLSCDELRIVRKVAFCSKENKIITIFIPFENLIICSFRDAMHLKVSGDPYGDYYVQKKFRRSSEEVRHMWAQNFTV